MGATELRIEVAPGRSLAATERGSGTPLVVFEAGMGAGQHSWDLVAPAVAERTRAITYDRAGLGASDPDPRPRTVAGTAAELAGLLRHLDGGPAVLVAHSYGGPIVRELLATEPDLVAGLVLVDQTDEACDLYVAPSMVRGSAAMAAVLPTAARLGVMKVVARRMAAALPAASVAAVVAESTTVAAASAHQAELRSCSAELVRLRDHPHPATDRPVTLITGTKPVRSRSMQDKRDQLLAAHQARAASLARGRHVRAEGSEHLVPFTEQELVVAEVLRLVEELRT